MYTITLTRSKKQLAFDDYDEALAYLQKTRAIAIELSPSFFPVPKQVVKVHPAYSRAKPVNRL